MKKQNIFKGLKNFLILWFSQAVSMLGTSMTSYALIIWVYEQKGTASSITMLSFCSFLPSIMFSFIAGTIADRWDKKRIMLVADFVAALGTATILLLYLTNNLLIWHLYVINFCLSFMNAFQSPASYVATTLLVPKEQYVRASGLSSLSGSIVTIVAPALGSAILAFSSLELVLIIDLATFVFAFTILFFFIKIPKVPEEEKKEESFFKSCLAGIRFLKENTALFRIILFFAFINFIAKMGGYGMLPALILGRTNGNQVTLGLMETAVGIGTLLGGVLVTLAKPAKSRTNVIFFACGISFLLGDIGISVTHSVVLWIISSLISNLPLPFIDANMTAIMRTKIPIGMQGRVFSARDTIQFSTIPLGLLFGGLLADYVFEPFMAKITPFSETLSVIFGSGKGSGLAVLFFIVGITGTISSFLCMRKKKYKELD